MDVEKVSGVDLPQFERELSWLSFNERVLQEAADPNVPLVERVRFLGIYSNNQDEFYRVRIADVRRKLSVQDNPDQANICRIISVDCSCEP